MNATHVHRQIELSFPPQVPFSWTQRWARAHRADRADRAVVTQRAYRIAGSAGSDADIAAAVAFCEAHAATLELD